MDLAEQIKGKINLPVMIFDIVVLLLKLLEGLKISVIVTLCFLTLPLDKV